MGLAFWICRITGTVGITIAALTHAVMLYFEYDSTEYATASDFRTVSGFLLFICIIIGFLDSEHTAPEDEHPDDWW